MAAMKSFERNSNFEKNFEAKMKKKQSLGAGPGTGDSISSSQIPALLLKIAALNSFIYQKRK